MNCNSCGLPPKKPTKYVSSLQFSAEKILRGTNGMPKRMFSATPNGVLNGSIINEEDDQEFETQSTRSHHGMMSPPNGPASLRMAKHRPIHNSLPEGIDNVGGYSTPPKLCSRHIHAQSRIHENGMQENAALRAEKESLKTRLENLEVQLRQARESGRNSAEEITRLNLLLEGKYKPMERELHRVKSDLQGFKSEKEFQINQDANTLQELRRELESTKERLQFILREKSELEYMKSESERKSHGLEDDLKRAQRELNTMEKEVNTKEKDVNKLREERDSIMEISKKESLRNSEEISRLKKLLDETETKLKTESVNLKMFHATEIKKTQNQFTENLNRELKKKEDQISDLKAELKHSIDNLEDLKKENLKNSSNSETVVLLRKEIEKCENVIQEMKEKAMKNESSWQDELRRLQKQNTDLTQGIELEKERQENRNSQRILDLTNGFKSKERELYEELSRVKEQYSKNNDSVVREFQRKFVEKETECNNLMRSLQKLENDFGKEQQLSLSKLEKLENDKEYWRKKFEHEQNSQRGKIDEMKNSKDREVADLRSQMLNIEQQKNEKIRNLKDELEKLRKTSESQVQKLSDQLRENAFNFSQEKRVLGQKLEKTSDDLARTKDQLNAATVHFEKEENKLHTIIKDNKQNYLAEINELKIQFSNEKSAFTGKLQLAEEKLSTQLKEFDALKQESGKLSELKKEIKSLKAEVSTLASQKQQTIDEKERAMRIVADDHRRNLDQSERRIGDLENQTANQRKEIKGLLDDKEDLNQQLQKLEVESKREWNLKLQNERFQLEETIQNLRMNEDQLRREKQRLEIELQTQNELSWSSKDNEIKQLKTEVENIRAEFERKETDLETKRREMRLVNERLNEQVRQSEQTHEKLLDEIRSLKLDKLQFGESKNLAIKQLERSEEEKSELEKQAKVAMETLEAAFNEKLALLQQDMAKLKFEIQNRDSSIHDKLAENERLKSQNIELEETLRVTMMIMKMMKGAIDN